MRGMLHNVLPIKTLTNLTLRLRVSDCIHSSSCTANAVQFVCTTGSIEKRNVMCFVVRVSIKCLNLETGHDFSDMRKFVCRRYDSQHWRGS